MVSTLRITSVAIILLAGLVVVLVAGPSSMVPNLLAGFALHNDPEMERILSEPSVVEEYVGTHGGSRSAQDTTSALVREAEAFKNILDPPPPPAGSRTAAKRPLGRPDTRPVVKPISSTAQFALVGTTVSTDNSFAYIRLQDKTYRWVRQGDEIGHLTIREIRKGSIVCWNGQAEVEMATESVPQTASLLEVGSPSVTPSELRPTSVSPRSGRITGQPVAQPWSRGLSATAGGGEMNEQEREALGDLVGRLRDLQKDNAASPDANMTPEAREAAVKRLIAEYKSSHVSPEEAERVEDLGRELNESAEPSPSDIDKLRNMRRKLNIPRSIRK